MAIENIIRSKAKEDFDTAVKNATEQETDLSNYSWSPSGDPDAASPGHFSMQSSRSYKNSKSYDIEPVSYHIF